ANAQIASKEETKVVVSMPDGAPSGPIFVTTEDGPAQSGDNFTVVANQNAPIVNDYSPKFGTTGTSVTINGKNLSGASAVKFNGVTATIGSSTDDTIIVS